MSELALQLIAQAKKNKSKTLDLGNCGLTEVPEELYKLTWLEELNLGNFGFLEGIYKESTNKGDKNQLTIIPKNLSVFEQLKALSLYGNQITQIEGLENLINLSRLDLSYNQITQIEGLENLANLSRLYLSSNQITQIEGLENLVNLSRLFLHSNQITQIEGLENLANLSILSLSSNQITQIEGLKNLANLSVLYLDSNQIDDNGISQGFIEAFKEKDIALYLADNPLQIINVENDEDHWSTLKSYFLQQAEEELLDVQLPQKILLLGNHKAGKSSLMAYLEKKKIPKAIDSTHILQIKGYEKEPSKLPKAIFYDFGGQDFYHGLYRVFMSHQSLHLLLWHPQNDKNYLDEDSGNRGTHFFSLRYWQGQKNFTEANSKLPTDEALVIRTHLDDDPPTGSEYPSDFQLNLAADEKLAEVPDFEKKAIELGREYFKASLDAFIAKKSKKGQRAQWYIDFTNYLLKSKPKNPQKPITLAALQKQYKRKIDDSQELESYFRADLHQFHLSGIVLYYPEIALLKDVAWLDPQGLVKYVHDQVLKKEDVSQGIVPKTNFESIDQKLLELLKVQKVIFDHQVENEYIIPNYLPLADPKDPDYQLLTFGMEQPNFVLHFEDFIPFGLINQLVCFFGNNPDKKRFWRNQLIFRLENKAKILIKLDFENLKISVYHQILKEENTLKADQLNRYLFLTLMAMYWDEECISLERFLNSTRSRKSYSKNVLPDGRIETHEIIREYLSYFRENIFFLLNKRDIKIHLSTDGTYFVDYQTLIQDSERTIRSYTLDQSKEYTVVKSQFNPFMETPIKAPLKIFISYSKRDSEFKEQLMTHLAKMRRSKTIEVWEDGQIHAGMQWDVEIKQKLHSADIIVCLVSQHFFDSDYIWENELKVALERAKSKECIIVPFLVRNCDWASWDEFESYVEKPREGELKDPNLFFSDIQFFPYFEFRDKETNKLLNKKIMPAAEWPKGTEPLMQLVNAIRHETKKKP